MQVTEKHLEWYALPIVGEPAEIVLNGYEVPGTHAIGIDDENGRYLSVSYRDDNPQDMRPSDIPEGRENRQTFAIVKHDGLNVETVGYRFDGLVTINDIRTWYRTREGLD